MAVSSAQVAVTSTPVALNTESGSISGTTVVVKAKTAAIFLGASGVTTATGLEVGIDATVTVVLGHGDQLFAVTATAATAHVLRTGA